MGRFVWVPPLVLMALAVVFSYLWKPGVLLSVLAFVFYAFVYIPFRLVREARASQEKNEALFRSMFPELQPHFHPARMVELVMARFARQENGEPWQWANPPGFVPAAQADVSPDPKGERVRLADSAGARLAEFVYDHHPEGGVIRVGPGKMTVDIRNPAKPRVRYWHPEREFKWSTAGWVFKTPIAEVPFASSSSSEGSSIGSTGSSGSSRAAAAGIAGLGGTFDGGGASAGWDDTAASSASAASGATATGDSPSDSPGDSASEPGSTSY